VRISGRKGEALHIEKEPVRLKEQNQILGLNPLEQIWLSETFELEGQGTTPASGPFKDSSG
jgi:hypothetical protein